MPQIGRVEITIIEEEQSRWLAFQQKELDYLALPETFAPNALGGRSRSSRSSTRRENPPLSRAGSRHHLHRVQHPRSGDRRFREEKIALRRAMAMSYDIDEEIKVVRKGQAVALQMPIPSGRRRPRSRAIAASISTIPSSANKLLDYFGYKKGEDGWRTLPDGKPLLDPSRHRARQHRARARRAVAEVAGRRSASGWSRRSPRSSTTSRRQRPASCRCGDGWIADYPDGDNFVQLLYGPNIGQSNNGCYESKAFDKFYERVARTAELAGAQPALPGDDAADGGRRRVEPQRVAHAERAAASVGPGLQEASDPAGRLAVPGRRSATDSRAFRRLTFAAWLRLDAACSAVRCWRWALRWRHSLRGARGRRHEQGDPPRVPGGRDGFDPAGAHDLYSGTVEQAIFETLLTYDYLARPAKLVPLTAEALPQITDDGRTYTLKLQEGHLLHARSGVQGQEARARRRGLRLLAQAARRSEDPLAVDVAARGQDRRPRRASPRARRRPASSTTTRRSRGSRPSTATRCAFGSSSRTTTCRTCWRTSRPARSRAKSSRPTATKAAASCPIRSAPALQARASGCARRRSCSRRIPTIAASSGTSRPATIRTTQRIVAEMKGKKMPQIGRVEISIMEEDQSRLLAFQNGELDLMNMEGPLAPKVLNGGDAHARAAEERRAAVALRRSGNHATTTGT